MAKVERLSNSQKFEIPCCAYVRVSTMKDEQESSYLLQESYWKEKLQSLPNRRFCGIFADQGISGYKIIQRKEYIKMIDLAKAGFIKEIYTKSIYRFGRNAKETLETIQALREKGVAIIFDEEKINTLTCSRDLILKLKAILGEQELRTMSSNVQFTARNNFKNGIVPRTLTLGYDYDEHNHMVINEEEAKIVRLIFTLYLKGYGGYGIAKQLTKLNIPTCTGNKDWNDSTIINILKNEKYVGDALLQKSFFENGKKKKNVGEITQYYITNDHEPIIDRETFNLVQEIIDKKSNYSPKGKSNIRYALSGKIECSQCGKKFRHKVNTKIINFDKNIWMCSTKERFGKERCMAVDIPQSLINEIILDAYNEYIAMPYELPCNDDLKKELKDTQDCIVRLKKLYVDNLITYAQYKKEVEIVQSRQTEILEKISNFNLLSIYKKPKVKLKEYSDNIVLNHIEKVIMDGYKIKIIFKNQQMVIKEYKYEHRKYGKNY